MPIQSGELPGLMSYVAIGDGPPLVVFPGMSREANGSSTRAQAREGGRYRGLGRATGRTIYVVHRPRGIGTGTSMAELATAHAAALRTQFAAPVDVLGVSTAGQLPCNSRSIILPYRVSPWSLPASWLGESGRQRLRKYEDLIYKARAALPYSRLFSLDRCFACRRRSFCGCLRARTSYRPWRYAGHYRRRVQLRCDVSTRPNHCTNIGDRCGSRPRLHTRTLRSDRGWHSQFTVVDVP